MSPRDDYGDLLLLAITSKPGTPHGVSIGNADLAWRPRSRSDRGSGTTAHVAEQWGRRWITSDTSRIALNIAKTRLMTATYPWYRLADTTGEDIRHGFVFRTVPHVTLKSLANDEPPDTEILFDQPEVDKKKLRVAGPFTVETLQSFEPLGPDRIDEANASIDNVQRFTERVFEHLKHAGIKNGLKNETAVFNRVDVINEASGALHAEGWYDGANGEKKAYFHIGPQGLPAARRCRLAGAAGLWLRERCGQPQRDAQGSSAA